VSGVKPESFGDRENKLPMGHRLADRVGNRVGCKNSPLLMATWAEAALTATEGDEHLMVTIFATNSGKAEVEVTASEEFAYHLATTHGEPRRRSPSSQCNGPLVFCTHLPGGESC
jgi:hypothetical protein